MRFAVNAAEQEVERTVEIGADDHFARPGVALLVRPVEILRCHRAGRKAAVRAKSRFLGQRCAKHAIGSAGNQRLSDRREEGCRKSRDKTCTGRGERVERGRKEAAVLDRQVVILAAVDARFLIDARERHVDRSETVLEPPLQLQFVGEVGRRIVGVDDARIGDRGEGRKRVGAVEAPQCERRRDAADRQEFGARQHADEGRIGIGHAGIATIVETAEDAGWVALAILFLDAQAVVVLAEIITHQVERRVGGRLPADRSADRIHVAVVDAAVVEQVFRIAVAVEVETGDAHAQRLADGQVDHALCLDAVVIAIFELARRAKGVEVGLGCDDVDDARRRIAPEQRALGTAQHLDPLKVEKFGFKEAGADERRFILVNCGRAVAADADAKVADAADRKA